MRRTALAVLFAVAACDGPTTPAATANVEVSVEVARAVKGPSHCVWSNGHGVNVWLGNERQPTNHLGIARFASVPHGMIPGFLESDDEELNWWHNDGPYPFPYVRIDGTEKKLWFFGFADGMTVKDTCWALREAP